MSGGFPSIKNLGIAFSILTPGDKASSSSSEVSADVPDRLDAFFSRQRWPKKNSEFCKVQQAPSSTQDFWETHNASTHLDTFSAIQIHISGHNSASHLKA